MIRKTDTQKQEIRNNMRGGTGSVSIRHLLGADDFNAGVRLCAQLTIPAKGSIGLHEHLDEDEIYIITQGRGLLNDGTAEEEVGPLDTILTKNGESHSLKNIGDTDLVLIAVIILY